MNNLARRLERHFPCYSPCLLVLGLLLFLNGSAVAQNTRIALVIGNSRYKHTRNLRNPANDAALLRKQLRTCGFQILHEHDSDNLSRQKLESLLVEFHDHIKDGGVALFYFAGHGLQVDGKNYLVTYDSNSQREFDVDSECVPLTRVFQSMVKEGTGEPKAETNIILLDCCRTNPFAWTGRGGQEGLAPESPLRNCIISFAAEPGKSAVDGQGKDSPYSQALAQHILVKGLDIQNMLTRVAKDVSIETQQRQYPESWSGLSSPFFFVEDQGQGALTHTMPNTTPKAETEEPTSVGSPRRFSDPIDLVRQILAESSDNEPNAFVPYLQFPMDSYHGQKHADASYIAADRERYIKRWPSREFQLISGPTMTHHASDGDYEVVTRSTYTVNNPHLGKTRSGVTIMTWRVHPLADGGFKISSIEEQAEKNGVTAKHRARSR